MADKEGEKVLTEIHARLKQLEPLDHVCVAQGVIVGALNRYFNDFRSRYGDEAPDKFLSYLEDFLSIQRAILGKVVEESRIRKGLLN